MKIDITQTTEQQKVEWQVLDTGEIIQKGDEYFNVLKQTWVKVKRTGYTIASYNSPHRRPIKHTSDLHKIEIQHSNGKVFTIQETVNGLSIKIDAEGEDQIEIRPLTQHSIYLTSK